MIKYYAYYNYGGYKDLFLGTNQDTNSSSYYLPLLAAYEESVKAAPNAELSAQMERWQALPAIIALSDATATYNYPRNARILMSHGGYKMMLKNEGEKAILSVRDIMGSKDCFGRITPFNFMLIAEGETDIERLSDAAAFVKGNMDEFEAFIRKLFVDDFDVNGLRFDLGVFNAEFFRMVDDSMLRLDADALRKQVSLFVIPLGMPLRDALAEQQVKQRDLFLACSADGSELYRAEATQESGFRTYQYEPCYSTRGTVAGYNSNNLDEMEGTASKGTKHPHLSTLIEKLGLKDDNTTALKEMLVALAERVEELEHRVESLEFIIKQR